MLKIALRIPRCAPISGNRPTPGSDDAARCLQRSSAGSFATWTTTGGCFGSRRRKTADRRGEGVHRFALRAALGTLAVERGVSTRIVAQTLGYESETTSRESYIAR